MNQDVLCIQPPSLRPSGSFRSTRESIPSNSTKRCVPKMEERPCHFIKYRERSYSDIQRVDKRSHRSHGMNHTDLRLK
ncbi:hypothetical protein WA026_000727 [Henosepilachna vigintioctopunctata]|uniref:Uncharacterized protein n=1 Tax=Henosepilachna vigintioctopunctata TaxID=420089 RepID=A0AAW1UYJ1_9CUCU